MRQLIGASIQLVIAERLVTAQYRYGVRSTRRLLLEELVDASLAWVLKARGIPVLQ